MTQQEALAQAFPGDRIERRSYAPTPALQAAIERRAKAHADSKLVTAYLAWNGTKLDGVGFFDVRTVRTMPGVFLVSVAPDSTVTRVDVVAFHEPSGYRPTPRWLGQFPRRRLNDDLWPGKDIRTLSGASLTTRAVTEATRLAMARFELLVAPEFHP